VRRKLTDEQVIQARQMYREGSAVVDIAFRLGCNHVTLGKAVFGQSYKEVSGAVAKNEIRSAADYGSLKGSLHGRASLDEEDVVTIRSLLVKGETVKAIAGRFGVSLPVVGEIRRGTSWRHVGEPLGLDPLRNRGNKKGENNGRATVTEEQVGHIKWHLGVGVAQCLLVKYFKTTKDVVRRIAQKLTWKHVKANPKTPQVDWVAVQFRGLTWDQRMESYANFVPPAYEANPWYDLRNAIGRYA
jgi:hypothetical protein